MDEKDFTISDINGNSDNGESGVKDLPPDQDISFGGADGNEKPDISGFFEKEEQERTKQDNAQEDSKISDEPARPQEQENAEVIPEPAINDKPAENIEKEPEKTDTDKRRKEDKPLPPKQTAKKRPVQDKKVKKKKKKKRKNKKGFNNSIFGGLILVTIILTVSLVAAVGGISLGMEYLGIGKTENEVTFNIPKNATTDEIADILIDNKIIENKFLFKVAMRLKRPPVIYPGTITLHPSMGYAGVIDELAVQRETYETVTVTFPEGITLLEAANLLQENNVCTAEDFLFEFNKPQGYEFESKVETNSDSFYSMEGFFFPDTYNFYVNDSAYSVTATLRQHFNDKITESMYAKMKEKHLSLSEVITIASIVQWEANSVEDMPKVASVFLNRLDDPDTFPSLQSDATKNYVEKVIKSVGSDEASIAHYTDCYDTYICEGLPAGTVCNPGIDAINAVLDPDKTEYYYFCNNLETGKSYFAKTLEEHEKNLVKAGLKKADDKDDNKDNDQE